MPAKRKSSVPASEPDEDFIGEPKSSTKTHYASAFSAAEENASKVLKIGGPDTHPLAEKFKYAEDLLYGRNDVKREPQAASILLEECAAAKHPRAMSYIRHAQDSLGWFNVARDLQTSYRMQEEAAALGDPIAVFFQLHGVAKSESQKKKVLQHLRATMDLENDPWAQYLMGFCYECCRGFKKIERKNGAEWYLKAAEAGFPFAMHRLAWLSRLGHRGIDMEPNQEFEAKWNRAASEAGVVDAYHSYGMALEYGEGIEKDTVESKKWFKLYEEKTK